MDRRVSRDSRRQGEEQREGFAISDLTDHRDVGRHAEEAGDEPAEVDLGSVRARRSASASAPRWEGRCRPRTPPPRPRPATTDRARRGSTRAASSSPLPGRPRTRSTQRARMHAREERCDSRLDRADVDELVERADRYAGELPDVHEHVAAAADVGVDDVHARAVLEPSILQALGRIELAVGSGRVVEQARERAQHVVVVVEDLVVEAARAGVPLHEDRVGRVDLDLPHVVVGEQRRERAVAAQVAERAIDHRLGVGDGDAVEALARSRRSTVRPRPRGSPAAPRWCPRARRGAWRGPAPDARSRREVRSRG